MENQEKKTSSNQSNDVDLGTLLNAMGRGFRSLGRGIGSLLAGLGEAIFNIIIFLKKRLIWLTLALIAGFSYGTYVDSQRGARYYSEMTAQFNFGSTRALYSTVNYLNALISVNQRNTLQQLLSLSQQEASSLVYFSVEPVDDELVMSELYRKQFLFNPRGTVMRTDTFWTRIIPYDKFKSSLNKFDIPMQTVTVTSTKPDVFSKVQDGLIKLIASGENVQYNKEISSRTLSDEEEIIVSSIRGLDTLRQVYNAGIRSGSNGKESPTMVNVLDKSYVPRNPELDLYDKVLALKDELKLMRNNAMNYRDVVQVAGPFSPVGRKVSVFRQSSIGLALTAVILTLIILVAIEGFKAINRYEKKEEKAIVAIMMSAL